MLMSAVSSGPGVASSVMLASPNAEALPVLPLVTVAVKRKASLPSAKRSSVVARRNCTLVAPAAIVTLPTTVLQVPPPSVETSSVLLAAVSVPRVAVPLATTGVNTTAVVLGLESDTVNTACAPSASVGLETLIAGGVIGTMPGSGAVTALSAFVPPSPSNVGNSAAGG